MTHCYLYAQSFGLATIESPFLHAAHKTASMTLAMLFRSDGRSIVVADVVKSN